MGDLVKQILAKPIQLTDQIIKSAEDVSSFPQECSELKSKTQKLAHLLRQAARSSNELYDRPTLRIIDDTEQVLTKALSLILKCRPNNLMKRMFTLLPTASFRKMSYLLDNSAADISWLLRVCFSSDHDNEYLGFPPIAQNEPMLCLIWEQIALLYTGNVDERADAAASLVSLARDNDRYGKLIIEEGGVSPLLKLVKEGKLEGQENAATAIGLLAKDSESVEHMIHAGVCSVFANVLKEGHIMVQAVVAWAVSELVGNYPHCQDLFQQHNIIRLLVSHLAFETVQEHSKYDVVSKATSMHATVVLVSNVETNGGDNKRGDLMRSKGKGDQIHHVVADTMALKNGGRVNTGYNNQQQNPSVSLMGGGNRGREMEDPGTKAYMKAMAARALWHLAKGNSEICRSITDSRALLCLAFLLDKGPEEVKYNLAMALMEITAVAEHNAELRKTAFKPNSLACKAVVDQLFKILEKSDSELLVPCVKSIGNLARTFKVTETRMISPLVKLLDDIETEVSREACIALTKFACTDNYLHLDHCKAIIGAGGAKHLVQFVYFGEQIVQISALVLCCYIALHVPDSEELAKAEVLSLLEWASKHPVLMQAELVERLLPEAKGKLELYQSRGSRGYHNYD